MRHVRLIVLSVIVLCGLSLVLPDEARAQECQDCWRCTVPFNPAISECCPTSTDGTKTCGLRPRNADECVRMVIRAWNCNDSYGCRGDSNTCKPNGGMGGGGGAGCSIPYGYLCPAECFSCTYYYY